MSDPTLRYYEEEMRYLKEAGLEFSKAHPDRAAMLNLDRVGTRDPYVERLFEGFAFLTGRIRQKLDDDFPELTEGLVHMLWPHYLRMIPSLTVLELIPDNKKLQGGQVVKKGLSVQSEPININDRLTRCLYRTTADVALQPLSILHTLLDYDANGQSVIKLTFGIHRQIQKENLDFSKIRIYISADEPIAFALRHALLNQTARISLHHAELPSAGNMQFKAVGFAEDERLWEKVNNSFSGYQLLLEYFCFKQKFFFIDLVGIDAGSWSERINEFSVNVVLSKQYPSELRFSPDCLKLNCVPAINLFDMEAEPIRVDHKAFEYPVKPLLHEGMAVEVYSVEEVEAVNHETGKRYPYIPFSSFQHRGGLMKYDAPERYFHTKVKQGVSGRHETFIMLGGLLWDRKDILPTETLSLKVVGTNGALPRKSLRETQIQDDDIAEPNVKMVRNLTTPTLSCYPPTEDRFQWRILSHLSPNYLSLLNVDSLKGALSIYDWTEDELNKRRLNGIVDVKHETVQRIERGAVHRGIHITVTFDSTAFSGEAEIYLFGELLNEFFAMYADLNLFTRFSIVSLPSGKTYTWKDSKTTITRF